MNNCPNLFMLSAISCKLAEVLTEHELALLAANLSALGDMLAIMLIKPAENNKICP